MEFDEFLQKDKKLWNQFIDSSPYSTILQLWEWGEVKVTEGWTPYRLALKDEGVIKITSQVLVKRAPLLGNYMYIPYGPVFRSINDLKKYFSPFLQLLKEFAISQDCFVLEIDPLIGKLVSEDDKNNFSFNPYVDEQVKKVLLKEGFIISKRNFQPKHKLFYDLTKKEEELMNQMKKNTRYNVRLSEKKGVTVEITKLNSPEASSKIDQFYNLLLETQKRTKGYPIRPKSTFLELLKQFKDTENIEILTASLGKDIIAMNISEFTSHWSSSFYGASNRLHPEAKASYLLRWKSVLRAKERGCKVYDFWGYIPGSEQHKGYSDNKLSFGGVRVDTYGVFSLPLSKLKYLVWDSLLPLRRYF